MEPTATPRPAMLREAIATSAQNAISALPRALPQAAGRLVIPGVGAGLSIGARLIVGQSITQAVTSTGAGLVGTGIGGIIGTAIGGPIGTVVGGMIGGTAGSLFSDYLFSLFHPVSGTQHLTEYVPNYPPFRGGQAPGIEYIITGQVEVYTGNNYDGTFDVYFNGVYGPINSVRTRTVDFADAHGLGWEIDAYEPTRDGFTRKTFYAAVGHWTGATAKGLKNFNISRADGSTETHPDIIAPTPPPDNTPSRYDTSPIGNNATIPSGVPSAGKSGRPNFHNKIFVFLENANNEANTIQNVANVPVSIGQAKSDLDNSVTELQASLKGDKNPDVTEKKPGVSTEENKPKKEEFDLGKTISKGLDTALDDLFDAGD